MTSGPWWLALLGLGCLVALAWSAYQLVRHPYRFDADLIGKYQRGEIDWRALERRQRARRRRRRSRQGS
jgi:peptidoglycan/LPS O-acetylase OafA/YrhL